MKITLQKTIQFDLSLSEEEAIYLRALLQNYLGNFHPEPQGEQIMRCQIFHELTQALIQSHTHSLRDHKE